MGEHTNKHIPYLKRCIDISLEARASGNTPFGALLVGPDGEILLEHGNVEITESNCTGHAETMLMEAASKRFSKKELWSCTLYTSAEPCAMCSGAIYWGNVGRVVFALSEKQLGILTGSHEQNPTLDLPSRVVFAAGNKPIEVIGPVAELEEEAALAHRGYWT